MHAHAHTEKLFLGLYISKSIDVHVWCMCRFPGYSDALRFVCVDTVEAHFCQEKK